MGSLAIKQPVIDSREVAEMIGVKHKEILIWKVLRTEKDI